MPPLHRDARKQGILEEFDRQQTWRGVCWFSKRFGVSRAWISLLFKTERAERYAQLRHPTRGRRHDLGR